MSGNMADTMGSQASLSEAFKKKVRPWIDLVDQLRSNGLDQDIALPEVVVIGDQSSGKSSTLEALSGVQLPRGSGIVTRCPLELRLKSCKDEEFWKGKLSYIKPYLNVQKRIAVDLESPEKVGEEVLKAQKDIAGPDKGISNQLITLEITSHNIPDLTLIDLPGITRVAVEGQPPDIEQQIKQLIKSQIKKESVIILAVVPCNVDISTTEAIKMAQEVDPSGQRTLGVLTKPDLIDAGAESDTIAAVNNQKVELKKGYTMVKCRGQRAIDEGQTLADAMISEETFFKENEVFRDLPLSLWGTRRLASRLTEELVEQIKKSTPKLKTEIKEKLEETKDRLKNLGIGKPRDEFEQKHFLIEILETYLDNVKKAAQGEQMMRRTSGGRGFYAKLREFYNTFQRKTEQTCPDIHDTTTIRAIAKELEQDRGRRIPGFLNYSVFEHRVRELVDEINEPATYCLKKVNEHVEESFTAAAEMSLSRFPVLKGKVIRIVSDSMTKASDICENDLAIIFKKEWIIFTQDRNFNTYMTAIERDESEQEEEEEEEVDNGTNDADARDMLKRINCYMKVCITRLIDVVPMTIEYHHLHELATSLKGAIMMLITEDSEELLSEDESVAFERKCLKEKEERLHLAMREIVKF